MKPGARIIVFGNRASNGGLTRVAASGGALTKLTSIDASRKEVGHTFPVFLPDTKHFVYLRISSEPNQSMGSSSVRST